MRRRLSGLLLTAGLLACTPGGAPQPLLRLVDRPDGPPAVAVLADEQRHVLDDLGTETLVTARLLPGDGTRLRLRQALPDSLAGASRLVASPSVRVAGRWERLPARLLPVRRRDAGAHIELELELPAPPPGGRRLLHLEASVPPPEQRSRFESEPVALAPGARLEFGMGVLEAAWGEGPVAFRVSACAGERCRTLFEESLDPTTAAGRRWQDRSLSLAGLAGRTRRLRFETRGSGRFSLPVWSNPTLLAPAPDRDPPPGLILISLDTLRADHLPGYGYPHPTAPFLEELGAAGTVFESLVASATSTRPSHASLFTSLAPSAHGVFAPHTPLPPAAPTLAEALRGAGFETAAFTENAALDLSNHMGRGFDRYAEDKRSVAGGHIEDTLARGARWLEGRAGRPFFLFLHSYQTHGPYRPPPRYAGLFARPPPGFEPHPELPAERDPALYDREIRYADDALRAFFERLEALGLAERTLVVITSDHGEEFLEHGAVGHGPNLHAEVLNVPLLLRGPGVPRGLRVAEPVSHLDLMPTLLEWAGVARPASLMGQSLVPLLRGAAAKPRPVFSETRSGGRGGSDLSVRLGTRKLIRLQGAGGPRHRYYDLADDPREQRDRFAEARREAAPLLALLDAYAAEVEARRAALGAEAGGPAAPDPQRDAKLRALGYAD